MPETRGYYNYGREGEDRDFRSSSQDSNWGDDHSIINGEMRFPSAMFYVSDAQRSDVATVCSGSCVEDIEGESVMSQEDEKFPTASSQQQSTAALGSSNSSSTDQGAAYVVVRRGSIAGNRVVEFTKALQARNSSLCFQNMGPPSNRMLQREYTSSHPGSLKSYSSYAARSDGGSGAQNAQDFDDCESMNSQDGGSDMNQDDIEARAVDSDAIIVDESEEGIPPRRDTPARADSFKSYGSNTGSLSDPNYDCGGSLDVETHSVGSQSIPSQDETSSPPPPEESETSASVQSTVPVENGHRSPGGTIYKGRGIRRYQGRYMHLPLKRFHQNGVHLAEDEQQQEQHKSDGFGVSRLHERDGIQSDYCDPRRESRLCRSDYRHSTCRTQSRSRSRSRSRSPPDRDDD